MTVDIMNGIPEQTRVRRCWWPGLWLVAVSVLGTLGILQQEAWAFQARYIAIGKLLSVTLCLLVLWWTFWSGVPERTRKRGLFLIFALLYGWPLLFRFEGMSGDWLPHLRLRFLPVAPPVVVLGRTPPDPTQALRLDSPQDFPQWLGSARDGVLSGPRLRSDWTNDPPVVVWRRGVGAACSGFAIAGDFAVTQEQRGESECVVAYHLSSGRELWVHTDPGHYSTPTAGEGPRATPTLSSGLVYAHGALGRLNCLQLSTGASVWTRQVIGPGEQVPEWGAASSPLIIGGAVVVHGGEKSHRSLRAFRATDGTPLWEAGSRNPSYASATLAVLAGVPQILAFNDGSISSHSPADGAILWERPWGNGNVVCAAPLVVGPERVLFSSGYGVGSELLELHRTPGGSGLEVSTLWKSTRMKSKFAHLFRIGETLYGLDDGIMAAVDLRNGSLRWKEGRYGHGQGLLVGEQYALMAESGDLILMHPSPSGPGVEARLQLFHARTWNPIALAGALLLARNDTEAVCLRLPVDTPREPVVVPHLGSP
ncbi:MAG TPA: hypothetical protein DCM86_11755 [Verrucomicrobiales bacterium]|nr:hypothetical protein [Verrucomicrobiales bacterium]